MKKRLILLILVLSISNIINAQTYPLGHREITYTDASRSNRDVPCHLYYPGVSAGDNVAVAIGTFPVIVFGHGFIMGEPDLYKYLWDSIATRGYICVFPTTESGSILPAPDHTQFALDLAFLNSKLKQENTNPSSIFSGKVAAKSAIMGHSMGGRASYIACKNNSEVTTLITFGAAIADPPLGTSIDILNDYARFITIPTLVISAEFDCVAPPADNQKPLYDISPAACKFYVSLKGGGHCYFGSQESSALLIKCETGESCSGDFTISRAEQNARLLNVLIPYLDFILKDICPSWISFNNRIEQTTKYVYEKSCNIDPFPVAAGNIIGTTPICHGQSGIWYSVPLITNAVSYIWSYSGTGATIHGTSNSVTIDFDANATPGYLTVIGHNDCGDGIISESFSISINTIPDIAGTIIGSNTVCQGQNAVRYSVPNIANAFSYAWSYSGLGATINGTSDSITIDFAPNATSGILNVYGRNFCRNGLVSGSFPITVNPLPEVAGIISGTDTVCQGQNGLSYTVPMISNADTYIWTYSDTGATIFGTIDQIIMNFSTSAVSSDLTVMGNNACGNGVASAIFPITVNDCFKGINENSLDLQLNIIPNPNNGIFSFSIFSYSNQLCETFITNSIGQMIMKNEILLTSGLNTFTKDISTFADGLYYIRINNGTNTTVSKLTIIK